MNIIKTPFDGLLILEPKVFNDTRGYFLESYNHKELIQKGIDINFFQDNELFSHYGTIRGLHYQLAPYGQTILARCVTGKVLMVAVDIRIGSPNFGNYHSTILDAEKKNMLLIPIGFAYGYSVLSSSANVVIKCDKFYDKSSERGIRYNDPLLKIDWKLNESEVKVSPKDNVLPLFESIETNFVYGANY